MPLSKMVLEDENKQEINNDNKHLNAPIILNEIFNEKQMMTSENLIDFLSKKKCNLLETFEIKELLDKGGESFVYKVLHRKTQKPCVLKIILFENNDKRNHNELNILNKLKHKNIINYYGMYKIENYKLYCIIMEYGVLGNMKSFMKKTLKENHLSESLLCYFACQILQALKFCHNCKICHYDIKPYNIIIDQYLNAKIIDFSVSLDYKNMNSKKIKLLFRGTNFYMAPEVIKTKIINLEDLNKIDLYSFGVTIYNLAFGCYPYSLKHEEDKGYNEIYNKIQNNKLEFNNKNDTYSSIFIDFLEKVLEKDINKRININQALNHEWIKGGNILFEEKEKIFNSTNFLIYLMNDNIFNFNEYLKDVERMKNQ